MRIKKNIILFSIIVVIILLLILSNKKRISGYFYDKAENYIKNNRIESAILFLNLSLEFDSYDYRTNFYLGNLYLKTNRRDKAIRLWKKLFHYKRYRQIEQRLNLLKPFNHPDFPAIKTANSKELEVYNSPLIHNEDIKNYVYQNLPPNLRDLEKAKKVLELISDKRYLGITFSISRDTSKTSVDVFKLRNGDCNEISYLYTVMLRIAGLDANVVYIPPKYELLYHTCVGVNIYGKLILVEPYYGEGYFDINHNQYRVLTDDEVKGLYYVDKNIKTFQDLATAKKLFPDFPFMYYELGLLYIKDNQYDSAITNFKLALKNLPEVAWIYHNIGYSYSKLGKYDKAIKYFNLAVNKYQNNLYKVYPTAYKYYLKKYSLKEIEKIRYKLGQK